MKKVLANLVIILVLIPAKSFAQTSDGNIMNEIGFVPEWAKKIVWYQIFPERFRNGDKSNDPDLQSLEGSWPHDNTSPWQVHPWNSDWYELQPYEKKNGKDIWFNIQRRRYGGDLQGILDKLDYLKNLGIGAIYLNPVFWAPSLHKYDALTFHHIDPHFGPDPEGDKKLIALETPDEPSTWVWTSADKLFLKLVDEVHKRDMKIIIDGVFNHMGKNNWIFKDILLNQRNSKYKDWFSITSWDDSVKGTKFAYEGWFGVKELPEFKEDESGIVKGPKDYIFQITSRWMDPDNDGNPSDGIDGWRLDVAYCVKHKFWKDWRIHVKAINPDAYLTAEIIDPPDEVKPYLQGDEFDAVMNYNYLFICSEYFFDDKTRISTNEFDKKLEGLRNAFPPDVAYVQQNLHGSHDTQRMASHIVNRDLAKIRNWGETFDTWKGSNPSYNTRKPTEEEYRILKLAILFQMTYVGAPYVYYGDEAGMWGANDPCPRKPMVWDDINYFDEVTLPNQEKKKSDKVFFNNDIYEHYKKLISIRNSYPVLQTGSYKTLLIDDKNEIYAFERNIDKESIIVVLNNGKLSQSVELETNHNGYFKDLLNGDKIYIEMGNINFDIAAKQGRILLKDF
jgi:cyclomaltodextrinase / maltogenic alpha-amylase / neopullulanase